MAKKFAPASEPVQGEELVVTVVRFKGSGETARKGIDALSQALASAFGPAQVLARQVNGRKPQGQIAAPAEAIDSELLEAQDAEGDDEGQTTEQRAAVKTGKAPSPPRKFDFISDISKNATTPLKEFVTERNPAEVNDKYLVACLWLQTVAGFDTFTGDHVWTCFQMMDWKKLADFMQPMRFMKSKKSYFDTPKKGDWKLNPHGLEVAKAIKGPTA